LFLTSTRRILEAMDFSSTHITTQHSQSPPFSIRILVSEENNSVHVSDPDDEHLVSLLPAAYRTETDDLAIPCLDVTYIEKELDLHRLTRISSWWWAVGLPIPPRPLHYQLLIGREAIVTERMDQHLVWKDNRIFLKPIPRFLLEPWFWTHCLSCNADCLCHKSAKLHDQKNVQECEHRRLWKCALGFLFSYVALITHESDFYIAKEKHLLPTEVKWSAWKKFAEQIIHDEAIYQNIDKRFIYGELRLSRLNKIYGLLKRKGLRGYMSQWHQYSSFFRDNFAWLAASIVYVAIVLTAMQVGLATHSLSGNNAFQAASYGFTVFSILGPLAAGGLIVCVSCYMIVYNWIVSSSYAKRRFYAIQVKGSSS